MELDKWIRSKWFRWVIVGCLIIIPLIGLYWCKLHVIKESGNFGMEFGFEFGKAYTQVWKGILFAVVSLFISIGLNIAITIGRFCSNKWGIENGFLFGIISFYLTIVIISIFLTVYKEALIALAAELIGSYDN